jgi:hypothetical protein
VIITVALWLTGDSRNQGCCHLRGPLTLTLTPDGKDVQALPDTLLLVAGACRWASRSRGLAGSLRRKLLLMSALWC